MTTNYPKSLSTDFGGNLNPDQLFNEIKANTNISPNCIIVFNVGDNVDIKFISPLSGAELAVLNTIIANHVPKSITGNIINNIIISSDQVTTNTYTTIASFSFPGTNLWRNVSNIKVISFMEYGGTSYMVRIYDITNNNQVCLKTFSNTDENIYDLGILSNLPNNESIFEVQAKISGSTVAYIKNINIYYDD